MTSSLSDCQKQLAPCSKLVRVAVVMRDEQSLRVPPLAPMSVGSASKSTWTRAPLGSKEARVKRGAREPSYAKVSRGWRRSNDTLDPKPSATMVDALVRLLVVLPLVALLPVSLFVALGAISIGRAASLLLPSTCTKSSPLRATDTVARAPPAPHGAAHTIKLSLTTLAATTRRPNRHATRATSADPLSSDVLELGTSVAKPDPKMVTAMPPSAAP